MKAPWRRGPSKMERAPAAARLDEALDRSGRPDEYEHVRTAQGRTAHLMFPPSAPRVLCGWPGPWVPADASLPVCRMCEDVAEALDTAKAAS